MGWGFPAVAVPSIRGLFSVLASVFPVGCCFCFQWIRSSRSGRLFWICAFVLVVFLAVGSSFYFQLVEGIGWSCRLFCCFLFGCCLLSVLPSVLLSVCCWWRVQGGAVGSSFVSWLVLSLLSVSCWLSRPSAVVQVLGWSCRLLCASCLFLLLFGCIVLLSV